MTSWIVFSMSLLMGYAVFHEDIENIPRRNRKNTQELFCEGCDKRKKFVIIRSHVYECPTCYNVLDLS